MPSSALNRIEQARKRRAKSAAEGNKLLAGLISTPSVTKVVMTGSGDDGITQPLQPAGMLNTAFGPAPVHEGEAIKFMDNGNAVVEPSPQIAALMGSNAPAIQQNMMQQNAQTPPDMSVMMGLSKPGFFAGTGSEGVPLDSNTGSSSEWGTYDTVDASDNTQPTFASPVIDVAPEAPAAPTAPTVASAAPIAPPAATSGQTPAGLSFSDWAEYNGYTSAGGTQQQAIMHQNYDLYNAGENYLNGSNNDPNNNVNGQIYSDWVDNGRIEGELNYDTSVDRSGYVPTGATETTDTTNTHSKGNVTGITGAPVGGPGFSAGFEQGRQDAQEQATYDADKTLARDNWINTYDTDKKDASPLDGYDPYKYLTDVASGTQESYKDMENRLMRDQGANNRENIMFGLQSMNGMNGVTEGSQNALMSEMMSNAASADAEALGKIGEAEVNQQYKANLDLIREERSQKAATDADKIRLSARIGELMDIGTSEEDIRNDPEVMRLMGDVYGNDLSGQDYWDLVGVEQQLVTSQGYDSYVGNTNALLDDMVNLDMTAEDILADSKFMDSVTRQMGFSQSYDELSPADKAKVDERANTLYELKTQGSYDKIVDGLMDGLLKGLGYDDTPEFRADVLDMVKEGIRDKTIFQNEDGTWNFDNYTWAWYDPDKMYKYVSFDGDDLVYNEGVPYVEVDGEQVEYLPITASAEDAQGNSITYDAEYMKDFPDSPYPNGLTNEDVLSTWEGLSDTKRASYYGEDGELSPAERAQFIKIEVLQQGVQEGDLYGDTGNVTADFDTLVTWDEENGGQWEIQQDRVINPDDNASFTNGTIPSDIPLVEGVSTNGQTYKYDQSTPLDLAAENKFGYYGSDGKYHIIDQASTQMQKIYLQFSASEGHPLTAEEFSRLWGDGSGYRINENGDVVNLTSTSASNQALIDAGVIDGDTGKYNTLPKPSDYATTNNPPEAKQLYAAWDAGLVQDRDIVAYNDITRDGDDKKRNNAERLTALQGWVANNKDSVIMIGDKPFIVVGIDNGDGKKADPYLIVRSLENPSKTYPIGFGRG